jgi:diguanylate cyclase (GGDEF)-like protein
MTQPDKSATRTPLTSSAYFDLALMLIGVPCFAFVGDRMGWFAQMTRFTQQYFPYAMDHMALGLALVLLVTLVFSGRRFLDMRREFRARLEAEQRVSRLAYTDTLTELDNRRRFNQLLEMALVEQPHTRAPVSIMLIDLDRFKPINEMHGHVMGDTLLRQVAQRLSDMAKPYASVARFGGDEFALILAGEGDAERLEALAATILQAMEAPFCVGHIQCRINASFGIATALASEGLIAAELIKRADLALYRSKTDGRGQFQSFRPEMDAHLKERARLEIQLRQAIASGEVAPFYQPLVRLSDGHIEGYEILARWEHPQDGLIYPSVFIPIAEDCGLINDLSLSLLDRACADAAHWPDAPVLSLNISPVQLRDPLLCRKVTTILKAHQFAPERLEVEITENALIYDLDIARAVMTELKAAGISIALDDFGTGYASLHSLRDLPFDKIKVDSSFVMNLQTSKESQKIVMAIIALGRSLGLRTTAEGIETPENAQWLTELGCETGQGYLWGRPASASDTTLRAIERENLARLNARAEEMRKRGPAKVEILAAHRLRHQG